MAALNRVERLSVQLKQAIASILQTQMRDPRFEFITVAQVKVSKDLGYADVYVSFWGEKQGQDSQELLTLLQKASGFIRAELLGFVKLRVLPKLRFHFDEVSVQGFKMDRLIKAAREKDQSCSGVLAGSVEVS